MTMVMPKLFGYHLLESGQRHGKWTSYNKDGTVRQIVLYDNGKKRVGNYGRKKKHGKWDYYLDGKLERTSSSGWPRTR